MIGVEISVLLSAILRALLGLVLTARLLGKCEHFSPRCALVGVAALGALAFGWPNPAQMMLEVAAMALCAVWLLGCAGRMSLFVATFYEIALALWSFLAAAWLAWPSQMRPFSMAQVLRRRRRSGLCMDWRLCSC